MKNIICWMVSVMLLGTMAPAGAQEVAKKDSVTGFNAMDYLIQDRYRYPDKGFMNKHWMDNMYVQIGGGLFDPNRTGEVPMKWMQDYHVALGKNFTTKHGLRLGFNFGKGGLTDENLVIKQYMFHLDHLFNVSAYIMGYDPDRVFEISTVLGAGIKNTSIGDEKHRAPEGHLGLELRYKVGPQSYLTLEPMVQITDAYKQDDWRHVGLSSGATLNYIQYLRPLTSENTNSSRYTKMSPFFIELATGLQFQKLDFGAWPSRGGSYAVYVGKWLSNSFGVRTGINASFNRVKSETAYGVSQHQDAAYMDGRFDLMLNPLGLFTPNGPKSWGGFHLLGGILYGYGKPFDGREGYSYSGYSTGLQGWVRLQDNLQLFMEPRVSFIGSEQEDPNTHTSAAVSETLYNLNVGLRLNYSTWDERKSRYLRNDLFRPSYFLQAAGGVSYSALRQGTYAGNGGVDYSGRISAGYRFSPYHALRANVDYTRLQSKDTYGNYLEEDLKTLSLDYMLGLSNVMQEGYDKDLSLSVDVYAGPVWNWDSQLFGGHTGAVVKKKLNAHTSLFVMPEITFLPKNENSGLLNHKWNPMFNVYAGVEYEFKDAKDFLNGLFPQERNLRAGSNFPFFIETGAGASAGVNTPVEWSNTLGTSFRYAIGHWINPAVAVRLSAENAWNQTGNGDHRLMLLGGTDVLFNPWGMSSHYKYDSPLGLNLVVGGNFGLQKNGYQDKDMIYGLGGGVQLWARLMKHTRFFLEPRYTHLFAGNTGQWGESSGYVSTQVGMIMDYVVPKRRTLSIPVGKDYVDRGLFFQLGGGLMTNSMKLGLADNADGLNWDWNVGVGYQFSPLWALRLGADAQTLHVGESQEERVAASLAAMVNLNTLLSGYHPYQRFSTDLYAGPSAYYNQTCSDWSWGGIVGMQFAYRANERMAFHLSPEWNLAFGDRRTDKRMAYKLGLTYHMNSRGNAQPLPWFVNASSGVQLLTNVPIDAQNTLGPLHKLAVGTWMNSLMGVRFAGTASANRWMNMDDRTSKYLQFYSFQPSVIFDPISLLPSYDRDDAKAGLYFSGGPEMGVTVMENDYRWDKQYTTGFNVGLQGWVKVGEHQRLFIEPSYSSTNVDALGVNVGMSMDIVKNKPTWKVADGFHHYFVQLGAGNGYDIFNQNHYTKTTFRPLYEFTAGYRIDPLSSIRFSLGHASGKKGTSLKDSDLSAAYQLNLTNLFVGDYKRKKLELEAFAGLSCIKVEDLVLSIGSVVGIQANYHWNDKMYFYVSPEARINHSKYKTMFGIGYKW